MNKEEIKRNAVARELLNAKVSLSKAINLIDQLYEDGEAELSECGKLYEIKNNLRDYIEEYRNKLKERESE